MSEEVNDDVFDVDAEDEAVDCVVDAVNVAEVDRVVETEDERVVDADVD